MPYKDPARERERQIRRRPAQREYQRQRRAVNREKIKVVHDRWYARHRDEILASLRERYVPHPRTRMTFEEQRIARAEASRRYRLAHPDRIREQERQYRLAHPERSRQHHANYDRRHAEELRLRRAANRAVLRERLRQWHAKNPQARASYNATRLARVRGGEGTITAAEWAAKCALLGGPCIYCGAAGPLTRDHKIPLVRGGAHVIANVVPACRSCNSRKRHLTAQEYLAVSRGGACRVA